MKKILPKIANGKSKGMTIFFAFMLMKNETMIEH